MAVGTWPGAVTKLTQPHDARWAGRFVRRQKTPAVIPALAAGSHLQPAPADVGAPLAPQAPLPPEGIEEVRRALTEVGALSGDAHLEHRHFSAICCPGVQSRRWSEDADGWRNEWGRKPGAHAARGRRECLLHQPRHVGDAFRRRARQGARHALRAGAVRGRGDRRRRRLLPHAGQAGLDPAAPGSGSRQRARQPAQRQEGQLRHRQHRRRARHLSHRPRRAAHLRHRRRGAAHVALGQDLAQLAHHRRRRRARHRRGAADARPDRHADSARGHRLGSGRRPSPRPRRARRRRRCRRMPSRPLPPCCARASGRRC